MIDKLISAYRAEVYAVKKSDWGKLFQKGNRTLTVILLAYIALVITSIVIVLLGIYLQSAVLFLILLLVAGLLLIALDRHSVRYYERLLISRQEHLKQTASLLRSVFPDINLHQEQVLEELVDRLTEHINERKPFKSLVNRIQNFCKLIVFPIITYIAGLYSTKLEEINLEVMVLYVIMVIFMFGIIYVACCGFSEIVQVVLCRDYHAALALRRDLRDLQLMHLIPPAKEN